MAAQKAISTPTSAVRSGWVALLAGAAITLATYGAALVCAWAQLHSAVVVLAWPTFALVTLFPASEPVTYNSPASPWPALGTIVVAWLFYSAVCQLWLRRRRAPAVA
jgi:hypothetical protein